MKAQRDNNLIIVTRQPDGRILLNRSSCWSTLLYSSEIIFLYNYQTGIFIGSLKVGSVLADKFEIVSTYTGLALYVYV